MSAPRLGHGVRSTAAPSAEDLRSGPRSRSVRAWAVRIVGTAAFIALLVWLDVRGTLHLEDVWGALSRANRWAVALSIGLYVPFLLIKAWRWRTVSTAMGMPVSPGDGWRVYAIGLAAGTFTPGQAGDAIKAWYLQRMGYPLSRALGSAVLDRLFDVAALALLGLLGVAVYGQRFAGQAPALVLWAAVCAGLVALAAWPRTRRWALRFVSGRLGRLQWRPAGDRTGTGTGTGRQVPALEEWSFGAGTLVGVVALTALSFATSVFRVWLLAGAVGVWLGPLEISGFVGLTTAAALVPVTVGGVGTRDAIAALAFAQLGRPPAEGIAVSALILLLNFVQAVVGWLVWLRYRA